jgi:hypothetical protein
VASGTPCPPETAGRRHRRIERTAFRLALDAANVSGLKKVVAILRKALSDQVRRLVGIFHEGVEFVTLLGPMNVLEATVEHREFLNGLPRRVNGVEVATLRESQARDRPLRRTLEDG